MKFDLLAASRTNVSLLVDRIRLSSTLISAVSVTEEYGFQKCHLSVQPLSIDSDESSDGVDGKQIPSWQLWFLTFNVVADNSIVSFWIISIRGKNLDHIKTWRGNSEVETKHLDKFY